MMMKFTTTTTNFGGTLLLSTLILLSSDNNNNNNKFATALLGEPLECTLVQMDNLCTDERSSSSSSSCPEPENGGWRCFDEQTGIDYKLSGGGGGGGGLLLLPDFLEINQASLVSGDTILSASSAIKINNIGLPGQQNEIVISPTALVSLQTKDALSGTTGGGGGGRMLRQRQSRNLESAVTLEGDPTFLVIHVTTMTGTPTKSMPEIVDDVFGTAGDPHNLMSQYTACSGGKLNYKPASGTGITNGGVAITINQNSKNANRFEVHGWVDNWISTNHPTWPNDFNHIMYVLPNDVDFQGAAAYAYVGNYKSVYKDTAASKLTVLMHETGHNLRMLHSGEGELTYADRSCYMGNPKFDDDTPQMCFNAAKSWHTGWYTDGHEVIDVEAGWEGKLIGIDDFNQGEFDGVAGDRVLLKIPHPDTRSEDLYIMYNRAKGVNSEVVEAGDKVVIVKGAINPRSGAITSTVQNTWRVAMLDNNSGRYFVYGYGVAELVIEVTEMTREASGIKDYAMISITKEATPTTAPTQCPYNHIFVEVLTDNFPAETSWTIVDQSTGATIGSRSGYSSQTTTYSETFCVDSDGPFTFTINDTYGDGICCGQGPGSYELSYNYQLVHKGGQFGRTESTTFGGEVPEPTALPSATPTSSPSKVPTDVPSEVPSEVPSVSPTGSPTDNPSGVPSATPTKWPSSPPTTPNPTALPSILPSQSPSSSPVAATSNNPTLSLSPTFLPTLSPSSLPSKAHTTNGPSLLPTPAPTPAPTQTPSVCNLAGLGESCNEDFDCCLGRCTTVALVLRVCL